eukprot:jgi/Tetstr1/438620/TSEL_027171.t1
MGDLSDLAIFAQLCDKHPSRGHPIPDAVYDIPVDEAARTLIVSHVKKLGEGGAPDVRLLAVGEVERRTTERAVVVDNMTKEAERILFGQLYASSGMWTVAIPTARKVITPHEAVPLGNTVPMDELKDMVPDAELTHLPAFDVVTGSSYDSRSLKPTLLELEAMRYMVNYNALPRATAVDRFEFSLMVELLQRGMAVRGSQRTAIMAPLLELAADQCTCSSEGFNPIIQKYFCDCVYDWQEFAGFACGLASILVWLVAQLPQLVENYRNKTAEALSAWFLVDWLMGDTCNLVGCLATGNQLATQVYTAVYFVCVDMVMLTQYLYYSALNSRIKKMRKYSRSRQAALSGDLHGAYHPLPVSEGPEVVRYRPQHASEGAAASQESLASEASPSSGSRSTTRLASMAGLCLLAVALHQSTARLSVPPEAVQMGRVLQEVAEPVGSRPQWASNAGMIIGYVSSVFYLKGRGSQIMLNCVRRSTEGLSAFMFINAILANVLYGLAIFLRLKNWDDLMAKLPWIIGSLGTVAGDVIILIQEQVSSRAAAARLDPQDMWD